MDILVTFDENYIPPFKTMLKSFADNHPQQETTFWLIHDGMEEDDLEDLDDFIGSYGASFNPLEISKDYFEEAKVTKRYPQSMYYRLLAPLILPDTLDKILYLDPDILVINPLDELWELELPQKKCFAAASHDIVGNITSGINKIRLETDHSYFNSGVILIDLVKAREIVDADDIIETVKQSNSIELLLPDQDVFNSMYGKYTLEIPGERYNYDARHYAGYLLKSDKQYNLAWVMQNTCILHFCGKKKPWLPQDLGVFTSLYKYFMYK